MYFPFTLSCLSALSRQHFTLHAFKIWVNHGYHAVMGQRPERQMKINILKTPQPQHKQSNSLHYDTTTTTITINNNIVCEEKSEVSLMAAPRW